MWKVKRTAPTSVKVMAIMVELVRRAAIYGIVAYGLVAWIFVE